ncbi:hypothetical protein ACWGKK_33525 [Streptomyces chartreusis]
MTMQEFLSELGRRLAEKWFSLLVLPGLLFLASVTVAAVVGQEHWNDWSYLIRRSRDYAADLDRQPAVTLVLAAVGVLLASAVVGLAAGALAGVAQRLWLGDWPRPLRPLAARLTDRLQERWRNCEDPVAQNRISLAEPDRPTWMGNSIGAVRIRVEIAYALHLAETWPHLWLIMPETSRNEVEQVRSEFNDAARLGAWGLLYFALGAVWWPSFLIGLVTAFSGWRRGRTAIDGFSKLTEAAVDIYGPRLARVLGFGSGGVPLDPKTGLLISLLARKHA